jgi:hypothetical protein
MEVCKRDYDLLMDLEVKEKGIDEEEESLIIPRIF